MSPLKIGLALSGAVARGPVHIGILSALEKANIPVDVIAGTSAGGLIGAAYAAGLPIAQMRDFAQRIGWFEICTLVWPHRGWVHLNKLSRLLMSMVGNPTFADLRRPFAIVATDVDRWEPVVLREGPVISAVQATCSVPGFITPVFRDGRWLGDGGVTQNLPSPAARALGADFVIGVDLIRPSRWPRMGAVGLSFQTVEAMIWRGGGGLEGTDFLISPKVEGISYLRFGGPKQRQRLFQIGEDAVNAALPQLRAALEQRAKGDAYSLFGGQVLQPAVEGV